LFHILNLFLSVIGHGPSRPDAVGSVIMVVLGMLLGYAALAPGTRLRGAFSHGKGPSVPIGSAGRLITLIAAAVMLTVGVRGLLHLN